MVFKTVRCPTKQRQRLLDFGEPEPSRCDPSAIDAKPLDGCLVVPVGATLAVVSGDLRAWGMRCTELRPAHAGETLAEPVPLPERSEARTARLGKSKLS
jgi:hypothetical protein